MALSLKDRIKCLIRMINILMNPKTDYFNLLWVEDDREKDGGKKTNTHTFFRDGTNPVNPLLVYMARVAGQCNSVEEMNQRAEFYLSKVAVAYTHYNPSETHQLQYIAQPLRLVSNEQAELNAVQNVQNEDSPRP